MSGGSKRVELELEANRSRERLLDTLTELDHRRHAITDHPAEVVRHELGAQLGEHARPIAVATGSVIAGVASVLGWSVYRLATRDRRRREERWLALRRLWEHPERLARRAPPEGALASQVGRKVLMSAFGWIAVELTKRALSRALPLSGHDALGAPSRARVVVRTLPA